MPSKSLQSIMAMMLTTLVLMPEGCMPTEEYTVLEHPTPQSPWPESTRARLQECVDQAAADMPAGEYAAQFDMVVTTKGLIREVRAKGSRLEARDLEMCVTQALRAMTVPSFVLDQASAFLSTRNVPRHLMGNVAGLDQALVEKFLVTLGPIALRAGAVGLVVVVGIVLIAAVATWTETEEERCATVKAKCIEHCGDQFIPSGQPDGMPYHDCLRKCLEAENCWKMFSPSKPDY